MNDFNELGEQVTGLDFIYI